MDLVFELFLRTVAMESGTMVAIVRITKCTPEV